VEKIVGETSKRHIFDPYYIEWHVVCGGRTCGVGCVRARKVEKTAVVVGLPLNAILLTSTAYNTMQSATVRKRDIYASDEICIAALS
jgi:hypothetical protein